MAKLKRKRDGRVFPVPSRCTVGRSEGCIVQVDDQYVSAEHTKISWTGFGWEIRDLGSRNGTFVNGKRIEPGVPEFIEAGIELGFGESDGWILEDASAPGPFAIDQMSGELVGSDASFLALPSDDAPELTIYEDPAGSGWVAEDSEGDTKPVRGQGVVVVGSRSFQLELPGTNTATPVVELALTLENISLSMAVSRDEERVEITLLLHGKPAKRLEAREHAYLLLTLARARREDGELPQPDRGWRDVPDLCRMLKIERTGLNVLIHRARQRFSAAGVEGAARIVEVRRGQRRLGVEHFEIVTLED